MQLRSANGPDRGSLSLVYACPTCGYGVAMLTNAHETQVVRSLGVQIGPEGTAGAAAAGKCPVTGMLRELEGAAATPPTAAPAAAEFAWSAEARTRLEAIPEPIRPMAKTWIERFANEQGLERITEQVLDRARGHFGL
jgi:hypothetical protein